MHILQNFQLEKIYISNKNTSLDAPHNKYTQLS